MTRLSPGQAEDPFEKYHSRVPFVKEMIEHDEESFDIGHVRTLLGVNVDLICGNLHAGFTDHCLGTKQNENMATDTPCVHLQSIK